MAKKVILITGSTDGIGRETAKLLASRGHQVLLHGRSPLKLDAITESLTSEFQDADVDAYAADLSRISDVENLAKAVSGRHRHLDVLINNAGVFVAPNPTTPEGLDLRFVVNTIAPYLLTKQLLPVMDGKGRVINLSSAAQSRVDLQALAGRRRLDDGEAYAQSKLAIIMWTRYLAETRAAESPALIAVNPGSFLGSKMVKEAYGRDGRDLGIGASILTRAALDDEFATAGGEYFDNDSGRFAAPHADARDNVKCQELVRALDAILSREI